MAADQASDLVNAATAVPPAIRKLWLDYSRDSGASAIDTFLSFVDPFHRRCWSDEDTDPNPMRGADVAALAKAAVDNVAAGLGGAEIHTAVARSIVATNKIEHEDVDEEEAINIVCGRGGDDSRVASLWQLIQDTAPGAPTPDATTAAPRLRSIADVVGTSETGADGTENDGRLSPERLCEWHAMAFRKVKLHNDCLPGQLRRQNVGAGSTVFCHFRFVKSSLKYLCKSIVAIARELDPESDRFFAHVVALASFAQFHLVTIHPFMDGNGRLCRFLAQFILDLAMPIHVPMYSDRGTYIDALEHGVCAADPCVSPLSLMAVTMDEVLKACLDVLAGRDNSAVDRQVLPAHTEEAFAALVAGSGEDRDALVAAFRELSPGETSTVNGVCLLRCYDEGALEDMMMALDIDDI